MASAVQYYKQLMKDRSMNGPQTEFITQLPHIDDGVEVDFDKLNFVWMLKNNERLDTSDKQIHVTQVRLELWIYSFNKTSATLNASKQFQVNSPIVN